MLTAAFHQPAPSMAKRRRWAATITAIVTPADTPRPFAVRGMRIPTANRVAVTQPLGAIATGLRDPATRVDQRLLGAVVRYVADPNSALYQPYPARAAWHATDLIERLDNQPKGQTPQCEA